jgi:hypothetical protein
MIAPGFGPFGFGVALLTVGTVLVGKGNNLGGFICDVLGVVFAWSAFRARRD